MTLDEKLGLTLKKKQTLLAWDVCVERVDAIRQVFNQAWAELIAQQNPIPHLTDIRVVENFKSVKCDTCGEKYAPESFSELLNVEWVKWDSVNGSTKATVRRVANDMYEALRKCKHQHEIAFLRRPLEGRAVCLQHLPPEVLLQECPWEANTELLHMRFRLVYGGC